MITIKMLEGIEITIGDIDASGQVEINVHDWLMDVHVFDHVWPEQLGELGNQLSAQFLVEAKNDTYPPDMRDAKHAYDNDMAGRE